jgi:purine-nucleoside phosphorylase
MFEQASEAAEVISAAWGGGEPAIAIVLGSGLDALSARVEGAVSIPYAEIPFFPATTVAGHAGELLMGTIAGTTVAVLRGRFHYYEGHGLDAVTFPIRVMKRLGAPRLLLTAATGGLRDDLGPGTIAALSDHLNLIGTNPLRGPNDERFGPRFPDMSAVYSPALRGSARAKAAALGFDLPEAVYACLPGPSYETPAEIRMLKTLGADVVGMSTVPEAIVARHCGMDVMGLAVVSNWAAGISPTPLSHAEVLQAGRAVAGRLSGLIEAICAGLATGP